MPLAPVKAQSQTHQPLPGPESRMEPAAAVVGSAQAASAVAGSPGRLGLTILGNKTGKHWAGCHQDREMPSRRHRCAHHRPCLPTAQRPTAACGQGAGWSSLRRSRATTPGRAPRQLCGAKSSTPTARRQRKAGAEGRRTSAPTRPPITSARQSRAPANPKRTPSTVPTNHRQFR